jgi:HlyD family secretion protein
MKKLIPLLLVAAIAFGVWKFWFSKPAVPADIVQLTGRIEGDDSAISPKIAGRIAELRFREGDVVKAGDLIARLDARQFQARVDQAQAQVAEADARVRSSQQQIAILQEQLQGSELQTGQSSLDAESRIAQAQAELAAAEATLAQQEASLKIAAFDRDAYTRLAKSGAVSERQGKQAESAAETQEAVVNSARKRVESARAAVNLARTGLTNPRIRETQSAGIRRQIARQQPLIAGAQADAARARAQLTEAQENLKDLDIFAPFDGTIATRSAEPGEVVQAGATLVTLVDLNKVYLRGFVPEGQIGKIKLGQPARVFLDSNTKQGLDAVVTRIDPQATFTPENTYFRDDRVKQVVGVKLQLKSGIGYAKPGMPADAEIHLQ